MAGKDGDKPKEYTIKNVEHDLKLIAKSVNESRQTINILATNEKAIVKRLEAVESMAGAAEDEDFGSKDRKRALSILADRVINPDDNMLPQMTETPDSMIMGIVIERARNEFIKEHAFNSSSDTLFSDILIKQFNIVMRSRHRALIGEAMGFSQIEMDKALDEEERKIALEDNPR